MNHPQSQITPASPSDAKGALLGLFEAFPADRGEGTAAVGTYFLAIEGYSLKAIQGAVRKIIRGEVPDIDKRFLPTPAQLSNVVAYCEKLYAPVERKMALPPPDDLPAEGDTAAWERRRALAEQAKQWVKDRTPDPVAAFKPREPGDIAREMRAEGMKLSAAAIEALPPIMSQAEYAKWLDEKAMQTPADQFDAWEKARVTPPTPTPNTDRSEAA